MAMNSNPRESGLRPTYDFQLPCLNDELTSRGRVFQPIPDGSFVLDVGCDTGLFGEALIKHKKCTVDGIEAYEVAVNIAKKRLNQILVRNIEDKKFFSGLSNYDVVLFLDVLEHMINPWAILRGVQEALKPGGKFT